MIDWLLKLYLIKECQNNPKLHLLNWEDLLLFFVECDVCRGESNVVYFELAVGQNK